MAHYMKFKQQNIWHILRHNDRTNTDNREHIDKSLSHLNYNLHKREIDDYEYVKEMVKLCKETGATIRQDSTILCSCLITLPLNFPYDSKLEYNFFKSVKQFLDLQHKEENCVSCWVHYDEAPTIRPHMHYVFLPIFERTKTYKSGLSKQIIALNTNKHLNRNYLKSFHAKLSQYLDEQMGFHIDIINGARQDEIDNKYEQDAIFKAKDNPLFYNPMYQKLYNEIVRWNKINNEPLSYSLKHLCNSNAFLTKNEEYILKVVLPDIQNTINLRKDCPHEIEIDIQENNGEKIILFKIKGKRNETIKEHYVPQFFLNNFALPKSKTKSKKNKSQLLCYCISQDKKYTTTADTIFFNDYLYEYDMRYNTNEMEKRFKENIEDPTDKVLKKLIPKCELANSENIVLDSYEAEMLTKYIVSQTLRLPQVLSIYSNLRDKFSEPFGTNLSENICKALWLHLITDSNSLIINTTYQHFLNTHNIVIIKLKQKTFHTSSIPILFEYKGQIDFKKGKGDDLFAFSNIVFPITPKLAVVLMKKEDAEIKNNHIYIGDDFVNTDALLISSALTSDIIVSPNITDETINTIKNGIKTYKPLYDDIINKIQSGGGYHWEYVDKENNQEKEE